MTHFQRVLKVLFLQIEFLKIVASDFGSIHKDQGPRFPVNHVQKNEISMCLENVAPPKFEFLKSVVSECLFLENGE